VVKIVDVVRGKRVSVDFFDDGKEVGEGPDGWKRGKIG
jgi:hypothetical protein